MIDFSRNPFGLAPMAGATDKAMRLICRRYGCGLQVTEMVSAKALTYNNQKSFALFDLSGEQDPIAVQLFGSDPEVMAEGARIAVAHGAHMLDVNMGCPVPKVAGHGEGSGLLKTPQKAWAIIRAMKETVEVPVSAKIRIGFEAPDPHIDDFARGLEAAGADYLAVHGRTRAQYYSGKSDWVAIKKIVQAVKIPVLANGDATDAASALALLEKTGAAGVLIGRGAMGRPWIFSQCLALWQGKALPPDPTKAERGRILLDQAKLAIADKGEYAAMREYRAVCGWYAHGLPGAAAFRRQASQISTFADLTNLLEMQGWI